MVRHWSILLILRQKLKSKLIEKENNFYLTKEKNWEQFINDDALFTKAEKLIQSLSPAGKELINEIAAPIGNNQELWACGVTYLRSKVGRQEESKDSGGADFYVVAIKDDLGMCTKTHVV